MSIPSIKKDEKGIITLYVNDKPFFARAGEIHNSSASDPAFMQKEVWPKLRGLHMNMVIAPVYWELIEAVEGSFDFLTVDSLIEQARQEGMKLGLLWFGLWKNGESMYVPEWMKKDTRTYFRVQKVNGETINTISPLCDAAVEKDKEAFCALMRHIRDIDGQENTVIVIQVENEIGVLGTACDYGPAAREVFAQEVPADILHIYEENGGKNPGESIVRRHDWRSVFGDDAEEFFMAACFAQAVEKIASAGKAIYNLPCYANAWLEQYPWYKGSYPTGGPVCRVHQIWKGLAPSLFAFAPDIYVPYCADVMDDYAHDDNPLFIPEIRKDAVAASYCLYAFLSKNAICFSPFGIEDLALDPSAIEQPPREVMAALNIDPSAFDIAGSREKLAAAYEMIENLEPLYLQYRGTNHLQSVVRHGENDFGAFLRFAAYDIAAAYSPRQSGHPLGSLSVFELEEDRFLLVGTECTVNFRVKPGENKHASFLRLEEGHVASGKWERGRVLNGDEQMSVKFGSMPGAVMAKMYKY